MRDTPLESDREIDATDHAITVHIDHYLDTGQPEIAETLEGARETLQEDGYIPAEAVHLVWDILMEHNHLVLATSDNYNEGVDRVPLTKVVHKIVAFNGDELYENYESYRERITPEN